MANDSSGLRRKLDAKGRISLPPDIRKTLPEDLKTVKVTVSPKGDCVYIFEPEKFKEWVDSLFAKRDGGFNPSNETHVGLRTVLESRGLFAKLDDVGRVGIQLLQREEAGLELGADIVVFDSADHIEVWDAKRWDEFRNKVDLTALFAS